MKLSSLAVEPSPLFLNMSGQEPGPPGRTPEDAEDIRLMGLASAGDMAAFEQLVERHQRLVVDGARRAARTQPCRPRWQDPSAEYPRHLLVCGLAGRVLGR